MRRLFRILSAFSLIMCLATAAIWVRSYSQLDQIGHGTDHGVWAVGCREGGIVWISTPEPRRENGWWAADAPVQSKLERGKSFLGFSCILRGDPHELIVPFWFLTAGFAIGSIPALRRMRYLSYGEAVSVAKSSLMIASIATAALSLVVALLAIGSYWYPKHLVNLTSTG